MGLKKIGAKLMVEGGRSVGVRLMVRVENVDVRLIVEGRRGAGARPIDGGG